MPIIQKQALIERRYIHETYEAYEIAYINIASEIGPYNGFGNKAVRGRCKYSSDDTRYYNPPALSSREYILTQIENSIDENKPSELEKLLKEDFILGYGNTKEQGGFHIDSISRRQGDFYTYRVYIAQPAIEFLILNCNEAFRKLLSKAKKVDLDNNSNQLYRTIIANLKNLDLSKADLSEIDLNHANLSGTKLNQANLSNTALENTIALECDFRESNISKKQLNSCKTYADAKIPAGLWPYWNDQTVSYIKCQLEELKTYGIKIQKNKNGKNKGKLAIDLADKLLADIEQPGVKFNELFQRKFLLSLHQHDHEFKTHRSYKRIIGNIVLCIMGAVVGYVIAAAINKFVNGHFSFFAETVTQQRIKGINKTFMPNKILHDDPIRMLALGVHHNLGKKSNLYKFFGHEKGKPVHPIGDEKVLLKIKQFIY